MRITNKFNLPEPFVKAVERHEHRRGVFSVTQLLKGSTEIALEMLYADEMEMDVSDMFNMLLGTAVHKVLEESGRDSWCKYEHYMEVKSFAGLTVSGTADVINEMDGEVIDYKTCSSWKIIYKDFDDWREQIKSYLYLYHMNYDNELSRKVLRGKIVAIIKDFSQTEAQRNPDYPQKPIVTIPFSYTYEEIMGVGERWYDKIRDILRKVATGDVGSCSETERWAKPAKYALMKEGRKSAVKLYDTEDECKAAVEENGNGYYLEYRKGEDTKCEKYCVVGKCGFCPYGSYKGVTC